MEENGGSGVVSVRVGGGGVSNDGDVPWVGEGDGDTGVTGLGVIRQKNEKEPPAEVMEYIPKRMSNNDRKVKASTMNSGFGPSACGRFLYTFIIFMATMSLIMSAIVHIFAWYEEDIEALPSLKPRRIDWFRMPREQKWSEVGCIMEVRWTFWIWLVVFFLQLIWIFYGMVLTCRRTKETFLYESACTMPCTIYLTFLIALGATAAWNVFWGESSIIRSEHAKWGAVILGSAAFLFHITLAIAVKAFVTSIADLRILNKKYDLLWNQLFTHNGLAAIANWETIVTMYAITSILDERKPLHETPNFACSIGLALIMLYMLIWFLIDLLFTKKALYYLFTPYIIVIIAFVSALVKNMATFQGDIHENLSLILSGIFLSITALFFVIKVITVIIRGRYSSDEKDEVRSLHDDNVYVMQ